MQEMPPRQQVNGSETIRMGQPGGLPNFNDPNEAGDDAAYGEVPRYGTLARRTQAGDDAQLAILKAFQDYMERERQRAQRRTNTVIIACAVLLTVLVAGFFAIWFSTMHGMQETQSDLLKAALSANENRQPPVDVAAAIASAVDKATAGQAAAIREAAESARIAALEKAAAESEAAKAREEAAAKAAAEAEAKARAERDAATREFEARLAEERRKAEANADAKESALAETLKKLNETIESVKEDNDKLRKDNEALRAAAKKAPAQKPVAAPAKPAATPAKPAQAAKPDPKAPAASPSAKPAVKPAAPIRQPDGTAIVADVSPAVSVKRPPSPAGFEPASIPLPVGDKGQVSWRVMIPDGPGKE